MYAKVKQCVISYMFYILIAVEPDGDNRYESYMSPPKKFHTGPSTPDRLIPHPLAHRYSHCVYNYISSSFYGVCIYQSSVSLTFLSKCNLNINLKPLASIDLILGECTTMITLYFFELLPFVVFHAYFLSRA